MKKIKAIIRLFLLTHLFFWHGIEFIIFADREITNYSHYVGDLEKDKETLAFAEYLDNQFDRKFDNKIDNNNKSDG